MSIQALAMGADGSIVAGMSQGRVARWMNGEWELLRKKKGAIQDVWVSPSGAVWMAGKSCERWAGALKKQKVSLGDDFMCVWGTSDDDVWVSGYGSEVAHWDGVTWQMHDTGLDHETHDYISRIAGDRDYVVVGGEKGIACWDGVSWTRIEQSVDSCLNGATTLSDGRVALVGQSSRGVEVWIGDRAGFERIVLDDPDLDLEEVYCVAAGVGDRLFITDGGSLLSWMEGELRVELRCEQFECNAVASDGVSVATATHEGVWILEEEWRLIGQPR